MAGAKGRWAWWNGLGTLPLDACVQRARQAHLRGVIVKWGHPHARDAFSKAGIAVATERYAYPGQPEVEARRLAEDVAAGARFAVINAEVEWETVGPEPMRRLIAEFRRLQPHAELYASVDTRGGRMALPYQQVLAEHVMGWLPMVYPLAFRPGRPSGYVAQAFRDCLDGRDFSGEPVLPTIQTYDGIGAAAVREQLAEVRRRGLAGCQAYTIAHASDEEWAAFAQGEDMEDVELREEFRTFVWNHAVGHAVAALFLRAAAHAMRGDPLPQDLRDALRRIVA